MKCVGLSLLVIGVLLGTLALLLRHLGVGGQTPKTRAGLPIDALAQTVWIEEFNANRK